MLSWTGVSDSRVVGYRVYYGTSPGVYAQPLGSGIDAGLSTTYTLSTLEAGKVYYFAVTAVDGSGSESTYSAEASKLMQ